MKSKKILTAFLLLFATLFITSYAQTKTITIIQNNDSMSVTIDTLTSVTKRVMTVVINEENLDSIIQGHTENINSVVKVMTIMSDSLQKFANVYTYAFSDGDDVMGNPEIDEIMVQIDTLDNGKVIKEVIITSSGDNPSAMHKSKRLMMISEGNHDEKLMWHSAPASAPKKVLNSVAISELHLLKKAGFSANELTSEPLEFKKLGVNIEREKTSDSDILRLSMDIALPEKEKVTVTLIDKNGTRMEEEEYKDSDKIKIEYKMDKDSAPYYIIVLQDKKIWSRKVDF